MRKDLKTAAGDYRAEYNNRFGLHRDYGPAVIMRSASTGTVIREEYWVNGLRHRQGLPAVIQRCPNTGRNLQEEFFEEGRLIKRIVKGYPRNEKEKYAQQRAYILY
jgi:hypothetical protein